MLAAPAQGALTQPVPLDPGNGASFEALPPFAWSPVPGAEQLPVPGRRRPELQLARARPGRGQLRHEEHSRDAEEDAAERPLLVARPRDDEEGRYVTVVEPALVRQVLDGRPELADSRAGLPVHLPLGTDEPQLVAGTVRGQLHVLARERPGTRERRHQQRPAGADLGDELRRRSSTCFPQARTTGTSFRSTRRATEARRPPSPRSSGPGRRRRRRTSPT